jgi:NAD(P)-dependent dehydrogenase (short-subunit alcohol dehydrogenase family)
VEDLRGAFALITGAAQGLGAAIARTYAAEGLRLALLDVQAAKLEAVAAALRQQGADCTAYPVDLADAAATQTAITQAFGQYGTPRVVIHNAAVLVYRPFLETTLPIWQMEISVILQAAYQLTYAAWPLMAAAGRGSIVYVSSRSGIEGTPQGGSYSAGKHALEGLMKSLAEEGRAVNIAVNTVTPGMYMHTPMSERNYPEELKPLWVDPLLLTPAFVFLARQDAAGTTGQRLSAWLLSEAMRAGAGKG